MCAFDQSTCFAEITYKENICSLRLAMLFLVGEPELNIWLCVVSVVWCPVSRVP